MNCEHLTVCIHGTLGLTRNGRLCKIFVHFMSPCWFIDVCRPVTTKFSVFQKTLLICLSTLACLHIKLHSLTSETNKNYNLIKGLGGFLTTKGNGVENKWQKYLSQIGHFPVPDGCTDSRDALKQWGFYSRCPAYKCALTEIPLDMWIATSQ